MLGNNKALVNLEELSFFEFKKLATATDNFQESNKLGEGGFGQVFRVIYARLINSFVLYYLYRDMKEEFKSQNPLQGKLADGQEIAVKRLSQSSRQGLEEFLNEAAVISKLQHRNFVKLLGCCVEEEEKILTYEYMPNKSLDSFLFGQLQTKYYSSC